MKAAQINGYGDASVIQVVDVEKPTPKDGQVVVEVHASSINPFDVKLAAGAMQQMIPLQFPFTLGGDIAGIVVETGAGVEGLTVGDKVYGQAAGVAGNSGAFAEFAATAASQVAMAPANLGLSEAAALPLVGVSAWQGLAQHIRLQTGQKVFIHGGAGGIGTIAIQIAKHIGAYVATTASGNNIQAVKELGADEVVDYKSQDFAEVLHDFDAVFDTVGGEDFAKSLQVLKPGGIAVSMIAPADEAKAAELGVTALTQGTKVTAAALDELRQLVEAGVVKPRIGKVFTLDDIQAAFEAYDSHSVMGKIVVQVRE